MVLILLYFFLVNFNNLGSQVLWLFSGKNIWLKDLIQNFGIINKSRARGPEGLYLLYIVSKKVIDASNEPWSKLKSSVGNLDCLLSLSLSVHHQWDVSIDEGEGEEFNTILAWTWLGVLFRTEKEETH